MINDFTLGGNPVGSVSFDNTTNVFSMVLSDGTIKTVVIPDDKVTLIDDLISISTIDGLTANQGKVLAELIGSLDIDKMDKITSVDNAIPRFDGVAGDIQTSSVTVDDAGIVTTTNSMNVATGISTGSANIELGANRTGDGYSFMDFHSDTTNTDYSLRLIRNPGVDGNTQVIHRGLGNFYFNTKDSSAIIFQTLDAEKMRIHPNGNLGVGTNSPTTLIHAKAVAEALFTSETNAGRKMIFGASDTYPYTSVGTTSVHDFGLLAQNKRKVVLKAGAFDDILTVHGGTGNVGIGVATPSEKLDVNGGIKSTTLDTTGDITITSPNYAQIKVDQTDSASIIFGTASGSGGGFMAVTGNGAFANQAHFKVLLDGSEKLRVDNNGDVGIGTSTPTAKLDVNGIVKTDKLLLNSIGNHSDIANNSDNAGIRVLGGRDYLNGAGIEVFGEDRVSSAGKMTLTYGGGTAGSSGATSGSFLLRQYKGSASPLTRFEINNIGDVKVTKKLLVGGSGDPHQPLDVQGAVQIHQPVSAYDSTFFLSGGGTSTTPTREWQFKVKATNDFVIRDNKTGIDRLTINNAGDATFAGTVTTGGDIPWTTLPLVNNWVAYANGFALPRYKVANSILYVQGLVKSGTASNIGVLPSSVFNRIPSNSIFITQMSSGSSRMDIASNGGVIVHSFNAIWTSITATLALD